MIPLIAGLALALLLSVVALLHEVRLRRALQDLLRRLLMQWRSHFETHNRKTGADTSRSDSPGL